MEMVLKVQAREREERLDRDFLAGVVYGQKTDNLLVKIKTNDFIKIYEEAGVSNLINLEIEGQKTFQVLVKETQKDPLKGFFIHVDFYKVDMDKEISVNIPLNFIGESKAVRELGGFLAKSLDELTVECLPRDLVDNIEVDISVLEKIGDSIFIKDIKLPEKIKVLDNIEDIVVTITEPEKEEEKLPEEEASEEKKEADSEKKEEGKKEEPENEKK